MILGKSLNLNEFLFYTDVHSFSMEEDCIGFAMTYTEDEGMIHSKLFPFMMNYWGFLDHNNSWEQTEPNGSYLFCTDVHNFSTEDNK